MDQSQPAYYAVIPASVRYSKVSSSAKLLYGEISALCNKEGYCWASNAYFAELYDVSDRSIRGWVSELSEAGFIHVEVENNNDRRMFLDEVGRKLQGGRKKTAEGSEKNCHHNNTSNTTVNTESKKTQDGRPSVARIVVSSRKKTQTPIVYGKREVNLVLDAYERHIGSKPVDRNVRNVANTFVRQTYKFIDEVKSRRPDLADFDQLIEKAFVWYGSKMSDINTYNLDTVRRHVVTTLFGNTLKELQVDQKS